jgi:acetyl-CoA synthetase
VPFRAPRDVWWHEAVEAERPYCPPTWVDSEDYLFFLYTSGSTGKPKGVAHSSGGYLLYAALTHRYVFDCRENDVYACVADLGWVTGHSYILYGPLCNGVTTFMFESTPLYPDASRYWDMVERHRFTVFYTAPTAIRALMKFGPDAVKKHDLSSLRMLGSVGEPINPEAWRWYHDVVGGGKRSVVDTFWQTETGGIMITGLPGCTPMKPGAASLPFFGVEPAVLDEHGHELPQTEATGILVMKRPWPGIARTVYGDHHRFMRTYMTVFRGYYFTGDGCIRDKDGYYWITGRVDDVINVSGHRIGSAEVESALVANKKVAEAAVVGVPHDLKGQTLFAYVTLKVGVEHTPELEQQLRDEVKTHIGSFAKPDYILITPSLPKTRSGKIMRRLLRKIGSLEIAPEQLGDTTTLADPSVVDHLIAQVKKLLHK